MTEWSAVIGKEGPDAEKEGVGPGVWRELSGRRKGKSKGSLSGNTDPCSGFEQRSKGTCF